MIVENAEQTESAITFITPLTNSDNAVLSPEKENCTYGIVVLKPLW